MSCYSEACFPQRWSPLFSTFAEQDDEESGHESTNVVITVGVVLLAVLTVMAVVGAPLIFRVFSLNVADRH